MTVAEIIREIARCDGDKRHTLWDDPSMTTYHYEIEWYCVHCSATGRLATTGYDWDPEELLDGAIEGHYLASRECSAKNGHRGLALKAPQVQTR